MKSSKEMADSVFRIRDAYIEKRNKRRLYIKRTAFVTSTACMFVLVFVGIKLTMPERPPQEPDIGVIGTSDSTVGSAVGTTAVKTVSAASTTSVQTTGIAAETVTSTQTQTSTLTAKSVASTTTATSDEEGLSYLEDDVETETETALLTTAATTAVSRRTTFTVTSARTSNTGQISPAVTTVPQTTTVSIMTQVVDTESPVTIAFPTVVETTSTVPAQIYERYTTVEVNKGTYRTNGWVANPIEIGELIGTTELVSNDSLMSCNATIYEYITQAEAFYKPIIIKFDGYDGYWIYSRT